MYTMETITIFPTFWKRAEPEPSQCPSVTKLSFQSSSPYGQFGFSSVTLSNQHAYSYRMGHVSTNRRTKAQKWYTLFSFGPRLCVLLQLQSSTVSSSATDWSSALPQQLSEQSPAQLLQLSRCVSLLPPHAHSTLEHRLNQSLSRFHTLPQISSTLNKFCLKKKANYYDKAQVRGTYNV